MTSIFLLLLLLVPYAEQSNRFPPVKDNYSTQNSDLEVLSLSGNEGEQFMDFILARVEIREFEIGFIYNDPEFLDAFEIWVIYTLFNGSETLHRIAAYGTMNKEAEPFYVRAHPVSLSSLLYDGLVSTYEFFGKIFTTEPQVYNLFFATVEEAYADSGDGQNTDSSKILPKDSSADSEEQATFWNSTGKYGAVIILILVLPGIFIVMQKSKKIPVQNIKKTPSQKVQTQLQQRIEKRKRNQKKH
ncbi:MAG: hypothetical protein ACTSYI_15030 [Promethearchaeota archaeon]